MVAHGRQHKHFHVAFSVDELPSISWCNADLDLAVGWCRSVTHGGGILLVKFDNPIGLVDAKLFAPQARWSGSQHCDDDDSDENEEEQP